MLVCCLRTVSEDLNGANNFFLGSRNQRHLKERRSDSTSGDQHVAGSSDNRVAALHVVDFTDNKGVISQSVDPCWMTETVEVRPGQQFQTGVVASETEVASTIDSIHSVGSDGQLHGTVGARWYNGEHELVASDSTTDQLNETTALAIIRRVECLDESVGLVEEANVANDQESRTINIDVDAKVKSYTVYTSITLT